jgi:hypothetical protein
MNGTPKWLHLPVVAMQRNNNCWQPECIIMPAARCSRVLNGASASRLGTSVSTYGQQGYTILCAPVTGALTHPWVLFCCPKVNQVEHIVVTVVQEVAPVGIRLGGAAGPQRDTVPNDMKWAMWMVTAQAPVQHCGTCAYGVQARATRSSATHAVLCSAHQQLSHMYPSMPYRDHAHWTNA